LVKNQLHFQLSLIFNFFQAFIEKQKEEHLEQLEAEKVAREQVLF